jgi:hypothetical protein
MTGETARAEWQGFALSHFEFDAPNAYRPEIGRLLAASADAGFLARDMDLAASHPT